MKKLSFILVLLSFFAFASLNACQQKPKNTDSQEEMTPENNTPGDMQEDTTMMDTTMQ